MEGSCTSAPLAFAPVSAAAGRPLCAGSGGILLVSPVMTCRYDFTGCRGISGVLSVHALPTPVAAGTHSGGLIPLPKNQVPYRNGSFPPAA
jgi:hypothetical protein